MFYLIKNPEERFSCCEIWADTEAGHGVWTPPTPGISQVAVGFLTNTSTDPPQEAIGPFGSNCFLGEVRKALCETRDNLKNCLDPTAGISQVAIRFLRNTGTSPYEGNL